MVHNYIWLNGDVLLKCDARIDCDDRGFRFGDGVFTTLAVLTQAPIFWDLHLNRLQIGLDILGINASLDCLAKAVHNIVQKNDMLNGLCRIIITRGSGSKGYLPIGNAPPTIYIETQNQTPAISNMAQNMSVRLHMSEWRRPPPNCLPNTSKIMQGMNPTLAKMAAVQAGYDEALMLSHDGFVSEAASSNIFWLESEQLFTPPLSSGCLNGVMRQVMMQIGGVSEKLINVSDLLKCNGAFLTNCSAGITPISQIDSEELLQNEGAFLQYINELTHQINIAKSKYNR